MAKSQQKMRLHFPKWLLLWGLIVVSACQGAPTTLPPTAEIIATETAVPAANSVRELTILYTNDEHGWMEGLNPGAGAAHLMGLWREAEGYQPDSDFVILSGGDMWTGPAISTWFEGQSMAEVMNAMGYTAAAVGNHEFDFGLDGLQARAAASTFPFLSANIRNKSDGETPRELGIEPYVVMTINDVAVGLIGLTTTRTPITTNPVNVADFDFIDYETALREVVPQAQADGAELILVPGHICQGELEALARRVADLGVHLLGGGHCNELFATEQSGIVLLEGGTGMASYAHATFLFDTDSDSVVQVSYGTRANSGATPDPAIEAIVRRWREEADVELNRVIGYTTGGIARRSPAMQALITESWLIGYPTADVAITNLGGMRADLPAGDITLADIITVMPFDNVIVDLTLTGTELLRVLRAGAAAVGGIHQRGGQWLFNDTETPIDPDELYTVLVNDFMYAGGDNYDMLAEFDPAGYNTAINWRQPVIDWIEAQQTTAVSPIEPFLAELLP